MTAAGLADPAALTAVLDRLTGAGEGVDGTEEFWEEAMTDEAAPVLREPGSPRFRVEAWA